MKKHRIIESLKYLSVLFQMEENKFKYLKAMILYRLTRVNTFPKTIINLRGMEFFARKNSLDIPILSNLYEKETTLFIENSKGKTFIDIGAYIGRFSLLAKNGFERIFAIEPLESNYILLKQHIEGNGLKDKIVPLHIGILDKDGEDYIYSSKSNEALSTFEKPEGKRIMNEREKVRILKLDTLIKEKGISFRKEDIIKIDTEGVEIKVLNGMRNILSNEDLSLIIEITNHKDKEEISDFLNKFDYKLNRILDGRNYLFVKGQKKWYSGVPY